MIYAFKRVVFAFLVVSLVVPALKAQDQNEQRPARREWAKRHPRRAVVGTRQQLQHDRIQQGVRSGELTKEEAKGLRMEQRQIQQEKKEALRDDGKIDKEEMQKLRQEQNKASKNIYEEKHDADKR